MTTLQIVVLVMNAATIILSLVAVGFCIAALRINRKIKRIIRGE